MEQAGCFGQIIKQTNKQKNKQKHRWKNVIYLNPIAPNGSSIPKPFPYVERLPCLTWTHKSNLGKCGKMNSAFN